MQPSGTLAYSAANAVWRDTMKRNRIRIVYEQTKRTLRRWTKKKNANDVSEYCILFCFFVLLSQSGETCFPPEFFAPNERRRPGRMRPIHQNAHTCGGLPSFKRALGRLFSVKKTKNKKKNTHNESKNLQRCSSHVIFQMCRKHVDTPACYARVSFLSAVDLVSFALPSYHVGGLSRVYPHPPPLLPHARVRFHTHTRPRGKCTAKRTTRTIRPRRSRTHSPKTRRSTP